MDVTDSAVTNVFAKKVINVQFYNFAALVSWTLWSFKKGNFGPFKNP